MWAKSFWHRQRVWWIRLALSGVTSIWWWFIPANSISEMLICYHFPQFLGLSLINPSPLHDGVIKRLTNQWTPESVRGAGWKTRNFTQEGWIGGSLCGSSVMKKLKLCTENVTFKLEKSSSNHFQSISTCRGPTHALWFSLSVVSNLQCAAS